MTRNVLRIMFTLISTFSTSRGVIISVSIVDLVVKTIFMLTLRGLFLGVIETISQCIRRHRVNWARFLKVHKESLRIPIQLPSNTVNISLTALKGAKQPLQLQVAGTYC